MLVNAMNFTFSTKYSCFVGLFCIKAIPKGNPIFFLLCYQIYVECVGQKEHLRNLFTILVYVLAVLSLFIKNA